MKTQVGFITSWRRWMFFTLVFDIFLFGMISTCASNLVGGRIGNMIGVMALFGCAILFILVLADKNDRFLDICDANIENGILHYKDKKKEFSVNISDITKLDYKKINMGKYDGPPTAYQLLIIAGKKKYIIESERAKGRDLEELGIHDLYLYISKAMN